MKTVAAASSAQVYHGRRPERTVLYRALAHHFEHFVRVYEERFLHTHGYLRGCVEPAVHRYLDCGIFDQGVARVRCPDCQHEFLIAFSCKLRDLCPSCHQKRELLWADWAEVIRCPIVLKRLSWETETGEVVCRGRPSRRGGCDGGHARWDGLEFLARVVDHIPEPSQQRSPILGFLRQRGARQAPQGRPGGRHHPSIGPAG